LRNVCLAKKKKKKKKKTGGPAAHFNFCLESG
jgi:hypothetical protein